jgi:hypothetical protein
MSSMRGSAQEVRQHTGGTGYSYHGHSRRQYGRTPADKIIVGSPPARYLGYRSRTASAAPAPATPCRQKQDRRRPPLLDPRALRNWQSNGNCRQPGCRR